MREGTVKKLQNFSLDMFWPECVGLRFTENSKMLDTEFVALASYIGKLV